MAGTSQGDHRWLLSPCYSQLLSIISHTWGMGVYPLDRWRNRLKEMKWLSWAPSLKGRAGTRSQRVWLQCLYAIYCPPLPLGSFCAGIPHQSINIAHQLKLHCFPECLLQLRYWLCRAWQAPRASLWGGWGAAKPSTWVSCSWGLSLLSQVKLWKPQPLITTWHRAPSGFRVTCIDSRSLHWTWVWAKFKPCHRQFNSFLWGGGNLMVNHNYWYNWYLNSQNNLWRCVEFKSVQLEFHLLIIKYSIIANCPLAHHILRQKFGVVF